MIIMHSAVFSCMGIIIFQLTEWIAIVAERQRSDKKINQNDMLGFSYHAIPTRHEVPRVPYLHEDNMTTDLKVSGNKPTRL